MSQPKGAPVEEVNASGKPGLPANGGASVEDQAEAQKSAIATVSVSKINAAQKIVKIWF